MKTMIQTTLLAAALLGLQARAALDAFIHFETVVDTSICIPDGTGTFTQFPVAPAAPAINGGQVAFFGSGAGGQRGLYLFVPPAINLDSYITPIADTSTAIPDGGGALFEFFNAHSMAVPNQCRSLAERRGPNSQTIILIRMTTAMSATSKELHGRKTTRT